MNSQGQIALRSLLGGIMLLSLLLAVGRLAASYTNADEVWSLLGMLAAVGLCGSLTAVLLMTHSRQEKLLSAGFAAIAAWIFVVALTSLVAHWITALALSLCWATFILACGVIRKQASSSA